ncbi:hypothetical protein DL93DRAFT_2036295, partial [Clavulina sp. PMI_390]
CLSGTREAVLNALINWAEGGGINKEKRVIWLCGVAGSGKSSIALSVALQALHDGHLGAYYRFSAAKQANLNPCNLFSTIATQLASKHKAAEEYLVKIVKACDIFTQKSTSPSVQLEKFVLPLLKMAGKHFSDTLIIIDAVDESGDRRERRGILTCLAHLARQLPPFVRVLVTTRYELDIQDFIQP